MNIKNLYNSDLETVFHGFQIKNTAEQVKVSYNFCIFFNKNSTFRSIYQVLYLALSLVFLGRHKNWHWVQVKILSQILYFCLILFNL